MNLLDLKKHISTFRYKKCGFKDVLNLMTLSKPKPNEPCSRIRLIALADVKIFSNTDFIYAKKHSKLWKKGTVVAIPSGIAQRTFIKKILPKIQNQIFLIIVDFPYVGTDSSTRNYNNFLSNKFILHVFADNWLGKKHEKLTQLPIGVESTFPDGSLFGNTDEKTFLEIAGNSSQPNQKPLRILSNAHLSQGDAPASGSYNQRNEMEKVLKGNTLCDFWDCKRSRVETWNAHEQYSHELCPEGNGLDTHRFYEALWLKTIPIVKRSTLTPLYSQYPCVIVDEWMDIKEHLLLDRVKPFPSQIDSLYMEYYYQMLKDHKTIHNVE